MKVFRLVSFVVILSVFLSACGSAAPAATPTSTSAPTLVATATQTSTPEPTATVAPTAAPVTSCKLNSEMFGRDQNGFGKLRLPAMGDVKTIVLFADFSDVPAKQKPEDVFALVSPNVEKFVSDESYGHMNWVLEPHFVWLRLSKPSSYYGKSLSAYKTYRDFIQEAMTLADKDVDFSTADSVMVIVPPDATKIPYGTVMRSGNNDGVKADGKLIPTGITSGPDWSIIKFTPVEYLVGMSMGLPLLWNFQFNTEESQKKFVGRFSVMGDLRSVTPEFFAFQRWQLGWLDDSQIICQEQGEATTTLSAIEAVGGTKSVIVPLSSTKGIVIESRKALGYDSQIVKPGVLVYIVDTSLGDGFGPIQVVPANDNDPFREQAPLGSGESLTVENVTITVTASTDTSDTVTVTVNK